MTHAKPLILLIDDDQAVVDLLSAKLGQRYEVLGITEPAQAQRVARAELPQVVLCDIDMPGMSGGDVAAALAQDSVTARIPLIYLTSLVSPQETVELGGQVGGRPGVSKRAPLSELIKRIEYALGER